MKVAELIALLSKCDPNGDVSMSIPADMLDRTAEGDGLGYVYKPEVHLRYSSFDRDVAPLPNRISIELPQVVLDRFFGGSDLS
jgi:hypothetical protein